MLFLSTCNNLVHCPVTLPRMRAPSQAVPMPAVCQSPYHTLSKFRAEANRPWRECVCPGSCTDSIAITLSHVNGPHVTGEKGIAHTLCLVQICCLLPAVDKGYTESSQMLLFQPPQTNGKAFAGGGENHRPPGRHLSGLRNMNGDR